MLWLCVSLQAVGGIPFYVVLYWGLIILCLACCGVLRCWVGNNDLYSSFHLVYYLGYLFFLCVGYGYLLYWFLVLCVLIAVSDFWGVLFWVGLDMVCGAYSVCLLSFFVVELVCLCAALFECLLRGPWTLSFWSYGCAL